MTTIYNILLIYGLTFVIGLTVSAIIWLLFNVMTGKTSGKNTIIRETYMEMKRLKLKTTKPQ